MIFSNVKLPENCRKLLSVVTINYYFLKFIAIFVKFLFTDFYKTNIKLYLITKDYFSTNLGEDEPPQTRPYKRPTADVNQAHVEQPTPKQLREDRTMESLLIPIGDLVIGEAIGKGGMGEVFKGEWRNKQVAVKKCFAPTAKAAHTMAPAVEREANVMSTLCHINVVQFYGYSRQGRDFYIVTELMNGSLDGVLYPEGGCTLTREEKIYICKEILR